MGVRANKAIPDLLKKQLEAKYGLDKPVLVQYLLFLKNAVRLDFGYSFYYQGQTIIQIFQKQWPYSIQLGLLTMGFSILVGMGLGIIAAMRQNSIFDYFGTAVALFCLAMPSFVFALILQIYFRTQATLGAYRRLGSTRTMDPSGDSELLGPGIDSATFYPSQYGGCDALELCANRSGQRVNRATGNFHTHLQERINSHCHRRRSDVGRFGRRFFLC